MFLYSLTTTQPIKNLGFDNINIEINLYCSEKETNSFGIPFKRNDALTDIKGLPKKVDPYKYNL